MLDIKKYEKFRFSEDELLNKKIKALYLLFDKYVDENNLNKKDAIKLIDFWISKFILYEEYELADAFKKRKIEIWKSERKIKRLLSFALFYRTWRRRINKFINKFINKKLHL